MLISSMDSVQPQAIQGKSITSNVLYRLSICICRRLSSSSSYRRVQRSELNHQQCLRQ